MSDERTWDLLVVGSAYWDVLVRGRDVPRTGQSLQGTSLQEASGGRGANQAVAAARLGARVALAACVGNDSRGAFILRRLRDEGVDTQHVTPVSTAPTGVATIQVGGDGEKQVLAFPGANSALRRLAVKQLSGAIEHAAVLLTQLEAGTSMVTTLAVAADRAGCRVVLDAAPAQPLPDSLIRRVHLLRANEEEARVITGIHVTNRRTAHLAASTLLRRGAQAACIQAGRAGDVLVWRSQPGHEQEVWLPRFAVNAVDATGAGDAFSATLAVMVARHRDLATAGRFASAAAAMTTTRLGAQAAFPSLRAIHSFLSKCGEHTDRPRPSRARVKRQAPR